MENLYVAPTKAPIATVDPKYAEIYNKWNAARMASGPTSISEWIALKKGNPVFVNQIQAISIFLFIAAAAVLIAVRIASKKMSKLRGQTTAETMGKVIKTERRWEGKTIQRYATVQFIIENQSFTETFLISGLKDGQEITVCYNPNDYNEVMIKTAEDRGAAGYYMVIAVLCLIIGIVLRILFL